MWRLFIFKTLIQLWTNFCLISARTLELVIFLSLYLLLTQDLFWNEIKKEKNRVFRKKELHDLKQVSIYFTNIKSSTSNFQTVVSFFKKKILDVSILYLL